MRKGSHRRPTPAMTVALVALFLALAGGAFAAGKSFVGSGGVIQGCVGKHGALSVVKAGKHCPKHTKSLPFNQKGTPGTNGTTKTVTNYLTKLPSGVTETGVGGVDYVATTSDTQLATVQFPVPAPSPFTDTNSDLSTDANNGTPSSVIQGLEFLGNTNSQCTGGYFDPTAPRGMLCVYLRSDTPANIASHGVSTHLMSNSANPVNQDGFVLAVVPSSTSSTLTRLDFAWAYTAP